LRQFPRHPRLWIPAFAGFRRDDNEVGETPYLT